MFARTLAVVMGVALAAGQASATGAGKDPRQSQGSMQQDQQQSQGSMKQEGTSQGSSQKAEQDPLMKKGSAVKGHASDQIVTGRIAKVSGDSVDIESQRGESKTLQLAPETLIDGKAGNSDALKEGQQVRASFSSVEGKDVAVEIHSSKSKGGAGGSASEGKQSGSKGSMGSGSGESPSGSGSSSGAGSQTGGSQQK